MAALQTKDKKEIVIEVRDVVVGFGDHIVLKGADLLIGWLQESALNPGTSAQANSPHIQVALAEGCAWSRRTERLLNGLGLAYEVVPAGSGSLPQISIDGRLIGGYSELAALHTSGALSALIHG